MATEKVSRILSSKTDMSVQEIAALSGNEAWALVYALSPKKPKDTRPEVCFTGFGATEKIRLENMAAQHGFKVVTGVTKKLDFLCTGENAGPKKIEEAKKLRASILTPVQLLAVFETGALP